MTVYYYAVSISLEGVLSKNRLSALYFCARGKRLQKVSQTGD